MTQFSVLTTPWKRAFENIVQHILLYEQGFLFINPFPNSNSKFDKNAGDFFKRVENTVGKGEIAHYEQFLLFPQCFQKTCTADT